MPVTPNIHSRQLGLRNFAFSGLSDAHTPVRHAWIAELNARTQPTVPDNRTVALQSDFESSAIFKAVLLAAAAVIVVSVCEPAPIAAATAQHVASR
jgi:hypothetical protein